MDFVDLLSTFKTTSTSMVSRYGRRKCLGSSTITLNKSATHFSGQRYTHTRGRVKECRDVFNFKTKSGCMKKHVYSIVAKGKKRKKET